MNFRNYSTEKAVDLFLRRTFWRESIVQTQIELIE